MVVAPTPGSSLSHRWRVLAAIGVAALLSIAVPVLANHLQTDSNGMSVVFDHRGGNEWWVEVIVGSSRGVTQVDVMDDGGAWAPMTYHHDWGAVWAAGYHVEPGHRVMFRTVTAGGDVVTSCFFTHPAGVEQCGSTTTTTTTASTTPTWSGFNPQFTGFRGNEYWVQANVGTTSHCVSKVDVRSNNGAWMPISKQSWGATAWAGSYHFPQGSILQMRATACDGQVDLSSCRQWIPASNTDATIVPCPGTTSTTTTTGPARFDATFTGVKGNDWWVQTNVAANEPLAGVDVRVNCAPQWRPLAKQSWGGWAASFNIPPGSKVDFKARSLDGDSDVSSGYVWPQATPTTGCALGAWPNEGSFAEYSFSSGVCGGGECMHASASLRLVYRANQWAGLCDGEGRHSMPDGTVEAVQWTDRLDGVAPPFQTARSVGAQTQQKDFEVRYGNPVCTYAVGPTLTVDRQELYQTGMKDAAGNFRSDQVWVALRDVEPDNLYDARWDTDLGMVLQSADHPRRSAQGSDWMVLTDTDAPLTMGSVVA